MEDFHQERAVLSAIAEKMNDFEFLVSYNGKCFDLPLLENRWTINRVDFDSGRWFHLDLLFPSRRLWKRRIGDCSLGNIEQKVLGVGREIDVPSFMIPQIYFDYLRTCEAEPLIPVFHHNSHDIVSLLKLAVVIDGALEALDPVAVDDPIDLYSLGRIHQGMGNHEASVRCFEQALTGGASLELQQGILTSLAFVHKRSGSLEEAAGIWQNLLGEEFPFSLLAHEELAKYCEHKRKDYGKALSFVERAMAQLTSDLSTGFASRGQRMLSSLEYRKSRLERKIKRASARRQS
jgi:tetratricopeptide (TPR) repeat protein